MASPTLEAYRQLNPQFAGKADSEVLPQLLAQLQNEGTLAQFPDVTEHAAALDREYARAHRPGFISEFTRGLASGTDVAQGQLYSTAAQLGAAVDVPAIEKFGMEGWRRNQAESTQVAPSVQSVEDVHGTGDAIRYGLGLVGSQAPQIVGTMASTAAGAGIGGLVGGPAGAIVGGEIGAGVGGYTQMQNYADLKESGGQDALLTSAIVGSVGAYLEGIVPKRIVNAAFHSAADDVKTATVTQLLARAEKIVPGLSSYIAKGSGKEALSEGLTEAAQEIVTMAGEQYSHRNDPNYHLTDDEIYSRLLNNAAAGAFLGGLFGTVEGVEDRKRDRLMYDAGVELKNRNVSMEEAQIREKMSKKQAALLQFFDPRDSDLAIKTPWDAATNVPTTQALNDGQPGAKNDLIAYDNLMADASDRQDWAGQGVDIAAFRRAQAGEAPVSQIQTGGPVDPETPPSTAPVAPPPPAPVPTVGPATKADIVGFTTAQGSTYVVNQSGQTTRTKRSEGRGKGETDATQDAVYVDADGQAGLGKALSSGENLSIGYSNPDGSITTVVNKADIPAGRTPVVVAHDDKGKISFATQGFNDPQVGRAPFEFSKESYHLGNLITKIVSANEASTPIASPKTDSHEKDAEIQKALQTPDIQFQFANFGKLPSGEKYVQVDIVDPATKDSIASTNLKDLEKFGVKLNFPDELPVGAYTQLQVNDYIRETTQIPEPSPTMEFDGDIPEPKAPAPAKNTVVNQLPVLRGAPQMLPRNITSEELQTLGRKGMRKNEDTLATTKKYLAVKDNSTGKVHVLGLFRSTGGRLRVANETEVPERSHRTIASALDMSPSGLTNALAGTSPRDLAVQKIYGELRSGLHGNQFVDELLGERAAGQQRYTPIALLDAKDTLAGTEHIFDTEDAFNQSVGETTVATKSAANRGVPQVLERLTQISPDDAHAIQILSSTLESLPYMQQSRSDVVALMAGFLRIPRQETFDETLAQATDPRQLLSYKGKRIFGLFSPEQWQAFKTLSQNPKVQLSQLLGAVDEALGPNQTRGGFISSIIKRAGTSELGVSYDEGRMSDQGTADENEGAAGIINSTREEGAAGLRGATAFDEPTAAVPTASEEDLEATPTLPDRVQAVTSLTDMENDVIRQFLDSDLGREIQEARNDSEISSPADDLEFQTVESKLTKLLERVFNQTRRADQLPTLSREFVYGVYSNLDKSQDSRPAALSYRVSTDEVSQRFSQAVSYLSDLGTDVSIIEQNVQSTVEFVRNEWGRAITKEDGRRMIVLSMSDVQTPTQENLRVLYHEIAHHLFRTDPAWQRRLIHEAIDRLADGDLDVFSKTRDARISPRNPDNLSRTAFLDEVLAEHLSFYGIDQTAARGLMQRFVDAITKIVANTALLFGKLTGNVYAPSVIKRYAEIRMSDFIDRAAQSKADLANMNGTPRDKSAYTATFYRPTEFGIGVDTFDPATQNYVTNDVIDESRLASMFNLDNKLQYSDLVVADTRPSFSAEERWKSVFGISKENSKVNDMLDKIIENESFDAVTKQAAVALQRMSKMAGDTTIRIARDSADWRALVDGGPHASAAVYTIGNNEILFNSIDTKDWTDKQMVDTLLHEVTHAAVANSIVLYERYLRHDGTLEGLLEDLYGAEKISPLEKKALVADGRRIIDAANHLDAIFQHLQGKKFFPGAYGMTNLQEFTAELMSNRMFQIKLAKVELPEQFVAKPARRSALSILMDWINKLLNRFGQGTENNAFESSLTKLEDLMMVADDRFVSKLDASYAKVLAAPIRQEDSDSRVAKDFERRYADLNSQLDFYTAHLQSLADAAKLPLDKYLVDILGVHTPSEALAALSERAAQRVNPTPINDKLRLTDVNGPENRVPADTDRKQIIKQLVKTVSHAVDRITSKRTDLLDSLEEGKRDVERLQARMIRFDTSLHDITEVRDAALKEFRSAIRGAERDAGKMALLSARHTGLFGVIGQLFGLRVNQSLPEDYGEILQKSIRDHGADFKFTDALTALADSDINLEATSAKDIEADIQRLYASKRDPRLSHLVDGSPKARIELGLLAYFAKTHPVDMAALVIRVERDPKKKTQFIKAIKNVIEGNVENTQGLNDQLIDVRAGDIRVGKARKALQEATRQLRQSKAALDLSTMKADAMGKASAALTEGLRTWKAEWGVRGQLFEPFNGAPVLLTTDPKGEPVIGKLELNEKSSTKVIEIIQNNINWLKENSAIKDEKYRSVADQVEKLKRVAGDFIERPYRDSLVTQLAGSIPDRLTSLGNPLATIAGRRFFDMAAKRRSQERLIFKGGHVSEEFAKAMKAVGFENGYEGFMAKFWNPANHFLQHLILIPSDVPGEQEAFAKRELKEFFMRNEQTREALNKNEAFESLWSAIKTNASVSKEIANLAAEWKAFVEDEDVRVVDPRTGKAHYALRPAMDVGLYTTQRNLHGLLGVKKWLEEPKGQDGAPLWTAWANASEAAPFDPIANVGALFTPDIINLFVKPYINDTSTLHLTGPLLADGETRNKATPHNVQLAFEESGGNMLAFAEALYKLEGTSTESVEDYTKSVLNFFKGQYQKIFSMTEVQEKFNDQSLDMLASPMMDNRKAEDFPSDFVSYRVYDRGSLHHMISSLAAHASLGRDLGMFASDRDVNGGFFWELATIEKQLEKRAAGFQALERKLVYENPTFTRKQLDAKIKSTLGDAEYERLRKLNQQRSEVDKVGREVKGFFASPTGSSRQYSTALEAVHTMTGFMLQNPKSAIANAMQIFEPLIRFGAGKTGWRAVKDNAAAFWQSTAGSIVQGVTGQANMASEYARFMNDVGVGLDPANSLTNTQILSDRGRENLFEDRRVLGWMRKGRSVIFNTAMKASQEGERVAPAFRPHAIFSQISVGLNQASIEGDTRLFDRVLKQGIATMKANPLYFSDPSFKFTAEMFDMGHGILDERAHKEIVEQFYNMGTTLELEVRDLIRAERDGQPLGDIVITPHLEQLIASEAVRRMSLPNDISSAPSWAFTSKLGRISMPLLTWGVNKLNQLNGMVREPNGEINRRVMMAAVASMMLGMIPASILMSMLLDEYDERLLNKKSALIGFNPSDPAQTAAALVERMGRVGTFGLAGDVINGIRVFGTDGDNRNLSFDQRVVFMNVLMSTMGLVNTAVHQKGVLTYNTFWRPFINAIGGGGILQNQQLINTLSNNMLGAPVFEAEAQVTARLNALNYLRGAGRVLDLDVRTGAGMGALPNAIKPYIGEMVVATYSNDREQFVEAYRLAVDTARENGHEDDAEQYIKRSYQSYHPLRYTFRTPPTQQQVKELLSTMSEKGQQDVQSALSYFNSYGATLGIKPYSGKPPESQSASTSPYAQPRTRAVANPYKPALQF